MNERLASRAPEEPDSTSGAVLSVLRDVLQSGIRLSAVERAYIAGAHHALRAAAMLPSLFETADPVAVVLKGIEPAAEAAEEGARTAALCASRTIMAVS